MLRPNWPGGQFQRTVDVGTKKKPDKHVLLFNKEAPTEVSDEEYFLLESDLGNAIFDVERDEKGRPRYVEKETAKTPAVDDGKNSAKSETTEKE